MVPLTTESNRQPSSITKSSGSGAHGKSGATSWKTTSRGSKQPSVLFIILYRTSPPLLGRIIAFQTPPHRVLVKTVANSSVRARTRLEEIHSSCLWNRQNLLLKCRLPITNPDEQNDAVPSFPLSRFPQHDSLMVLKVLRLTDYKPKTQNSALDGCAPSKLFYLSFSKELTVR